MVKVRWIWQLSGFMVFGILAVYAIGSLQSSGVNVLILLAPFVALVLAVAVRQAAGRIAPLIKSLTSWHGLWILSFLSALVLRERTATDIGASPIDPAAAYRIALVAITFTVLAIRLAVKRPPWLGSLCRGLVGALTCYAGVSLISTLWSAYPAWTLYKSWEYMVDIALLAAILATVHSAREYGDLLNLTWAWYGLLLMSVWVGLLVWPAVALKPQAGVLGVQLHGVLPEVTANSVGEFGGILAVVSLRRLLLPTNIGSDRWWYGLVCTFSLTTLVLSQTRSATAGFLVGAVLVVLFAKGKGVTAFLLLAGAAVISVGGIGAFLWEFLRRGQSSELFESLSGRLDYWQLGWEQFLKSPLTGLGAYTARFEVLSKLGESGGSSIHNSFFEVIVGMGFAGLIPLLVGLFGTWWLLIRSLRNSSLDPLERGLAIEALGVLAVVSVRSLFASNLVWHPAFQFLIVVGYAEFLRRRLKYLPLPS